MQTNEESEMDEDGALKLELYCGGTILEISAGSGQINLYRPEALKLLAELPSMINQMPG